MPETTDDVVGALPRFDPGSPLDPPSELMEEEVASPPPPTTSPPQPPGSRDGPSERSGTSSTGSSEPPVDLSDAFGELGKGIALVLGLVMNRLHDRMTRRRSDAWLMTEEEAEAVGGAIGHMASRRVPQEVATGDGADAISGVAALIPWAARNLMPAAGEPEVAEAESYVPPPGPTVAPPPVITPDL